MEFRISEEEARAMARFEEEVGCDPIAGPDYGVHLDQVMALGMRRVGYEDLVALLAERAGDVLSTEEIEAIAWRAEAQIHELVVRKVCDRESA
jgi:protein-L-isoaspartate O-methyltransferase